MISECFDNGIHYKIYCENVLLWLRDPMADYNGKRCKPQFLTFQNSVQKSKSKKKYINSNPSWCKQVQAAFFFKLPVLPEKPSKLRGIRHFEILFLLFFTSQTYQIEIKQTYQNKDILQRYYLTTERLASTSYSMQYYRNKI